jgi:hypothetical protein
MPNLILTQVQVFVIQMEMALENRLDLDSDNDGCSDALETKTTNNS